MVLGAWPYMAFAKRNGELMADSASEASGAWESFLASFIGMGQTFMGRLPYIFIGIVVFVGIILIGKLGAAGIRYTRDKTKLDPMLAELLVKLTGAFSIVLGALLALVVIFPAFKPGDLIAGLGITGVAVSFAFKDILQNFFAGIIILWRRPFHLGDQIRVSSHEGKVEDINIRTTIIRTYDGERVLIPNADVFTSAVIVRTAYESRRTKFTVGIGYPDSIPEAKAIIEKALRDTQGVLANPLPLVGVGALSPSSVDLDAFYWTEPEQATVLRVSLDVAANIKMALDDAGIDMPYPHTVLHLAKDAIEALERLPSRDKKFSKSFVSAESNQNSPDHNLM